MIQTKVEGIDGVLAFVSEIKKAKEMTLEVGLPKGTGIYPTGETIVGVGAVHEFGSSKTPRRSFLRVPFKIHEAKIDKMFNKAFRSIGEGKSTASSAMGKMGVFVTNISKGAFTTKGYGKWTDIKPSTKQAKGSSQVLIDTSLLRNSITWRVK